jgi:hypothetical protein
MALLAVFGSHKRMIGGTGTHRRESQKNGCDRDCDQQESSHSPTLLSEYILTEVHLPVGDSFLLWEIVHLDLVWR